jgi:hypothetical protein
MNFTIAITIRERRNSKTVITKKGDESSGKKRIVKDKKKA